MRNALKTALSLACVVLLPALSFAQSELRVFSQGSELAAAVAAGEAEIGITFTSELRPTSGVTVAGTLPADIQLPTIYAAAIVTNAPNAAAARAFLGALAGAEGRAAVAKAGLEPVGVPAR